jgi:ribose transport system substrate-binding protein
MKTKLFVFIVLVSMILSGCAQAAKPGMYVLISPNRQHPVVRTAALGFWEACADLKVQCKDLSYDGVDLSQQAVSTDQAIAMKAIGAVAFVDKAVYAQDNRLIAAGIPTVSISVRVQPSDVPGLLGWVACDQGDYARRIADFMGEKMGGKGMIATTQIDLNDVENLVQAEFAKEIAAKYPNIKVLDPQMEGADQIQAIAKATAILQAHPDITAAFGSTGGSPTTWAKAAEGVGKKPGDMIIVGMDYTRPNLDLVKAGWVTALVGQPIYEYGYTSLQLLVEHNQGKQVAFDNPYPAPIITVKDIDKYYGYADRVDKMIGNK